MGIGRDSNHSPRQAVAFFTHLFDPLVERRYRKLKADIGDQAQVFILAQVGTPIRSDFINETYFFDYDRLRSGAPKLIGDQVIPGNAHLVALDFYRNNPDFEFYWFIEYDVVFTGNWSALLRAVRNDSADLLASHIRSFEEEPAWTWWESLELPGYTREPSARLRAFFPVYRISRAALQAVDDRVKKGWSGHFEGLIPCAVQSASLSISDIGGTGTWTPKDRRGKFYSSFSSEDGLYLNAGTHRYRPSHYLPPMRRNYIFHPVKHDSIFGQKKWMVRILRRSLNEIRMLLNFAR
jgi:hypothetical protein